MTRSVIVHPDEAVLAAAIAARLLVALADAQASRGAASVALTGGGIGTASLAAVTSNPARDSVDWSRVDFWWGDERFLPAGDQERNETGARLALLDHIPADPARIHPMASSDSGIDVDAAAAQYAALVPSSFDVVLLGIGPEGHVASLFPGAPALGDDRPAVAVRNSPKPPPTRISLTLGPIRSAREVWILASGSSKADAITAVASGAPVTDWPAAGATGRERTLLLVDREAAAALPSRVLAHDGRRRCAGQTPSWRTRCAVSRKLVWIQLLSQKLFPHNLGARPKCPVSDTDITGITISTHRDGAHPRVPYRESGSGTG